MQVPLPRRPPAKKELFWIIQPCPATQEGRLQPGRGTHFRSHGLRVSQKGGTGLSGQLCLHSHPSASQTGWGRGWERMRHPEVTVWPQQALLSEPWGRPRLWGRKGLGPVQGAQLEDPL